MLSFSFQGYHLITIQRSEIRTVYVYLQLDAISYSCSHLSNFPGFKVKWSAWSLSPNSNSSCLLHLQLSPRRCEWINEWHNLKKILQRLMLKQHEGNRNEKMRSLRTHYPFNMNDGWLTKTQITKKLKRSPVHSEIVMLPFWKWIVYTISQKWSSYWKFESVRIWISLWVLGDWFK